MATYHAPDDVLLHIAEPADPRERADAVSVTLDRHEALVFADACASHAAYHETDEIKRDIAQHLGQWCEHAVCDRHDHTVPLYLHTETARTVANDVCSLTAADAYGMLEHIGDALP
jgi:hypothetical protein